MILAGFKNGKRNAVTGDQRMPRDLIGTTLCHEQQNNSEPSLDRTNWNRVPYSPELDPTDCRANDNRTGKADRQLTSCL